MLFSVQAIFHQTVGICGGGITLVDKSNRKMRQVRKSGNVGNLCCHGSDPSTSRSDLGIACTNRHQSPKAMDGVTTQCNRSCLAIHLLAMQSTHHHHYFILQYILPFCVLRYCKTSPVLMDYCVLSLKAGAQQGSLKTSVLNSKPVMRSNKHQEIGCFNLEYL